MVTNSSLVSLDIEMLVQKMSDSVRDQINTVTSVLKVSLESVVERGECKNRVNKNLNK